MVADISYDTVSNVVESWELLRRVDGYQEKAGVELFRIFFAMEPQAAKVFNFSPDEVKGEKFEKNIRIVKHASNYMKMVDRAINMLGPDIELLTEIMLKLGENHVSYGVKPAYYSPMGRALLEVLEKFLGDQFTPHMKDCWLETYQALSYDMIRAKKL